MEEQEKVIGRRKFNDVELSDEEKPQNAHNAVTNIGDDLKMCVPICHSPIRLRENMVLTSSAMHVHYYPADVGKYVYWQSGRQYRPFTGL